MIDDLVALSGELAFEANRLTRGLRRLEVMLPEEIVQSVDKLNALTRNLISQVNADRQVKCDGLFLDASKVIEQASQKFEKPITVEYKNCEMKLDRDVAKLFKPVFLEMLELFVEFCIEPARERAARKKKSAAHVQLELRPDPHGYRLMVICDGNGIIPPLASEHGVRLAQIHVRANFEGKPGRWSAWVFHLPLGIYSLRCVPIRSQGQAFFLPEWAVTGKRTEEAGKQSLEISAGIHSVFYPVETIGSSEEVYIKPLRGTLNVQGRYIGVVTQEDGSPELGLVLNPAFLVYGAEAML